MAPFDSTSLVRSTWIVVTLTRASYRLFCGRCHCRCLRVRVASIIGQKFEAGLDEHRGECLLRDPASAAIVDGALQYFHGKRYTLLAWSVMPSHVHVVMHLEVGADLSRVLHSWKSYSAKMINRAHGRTGRVWQREYFDRVVRDERELGNVVEYTVNNPAKAGLVDWPFVGVCPWK